MDQPTPSTSSSVSPSGVKRYRRSTGLTRPQQQSEATSAGRIRGPRFFAEPIAVRLEPVLTKPAIQLHARDTQLPRSVQLVTVGLAHHALDRAPLDAVEISVVTHRRRWSQREIRPTTCELRANRGFVRPRSFDGEPALLLNGTPHRERFREQPFAGVVQRPGGVQAGLRFLARPLQSQSSRPAPPCP